VGDELHRRPPGCYSIQRWCVRSQTAGFVEPRPPAVADDWWHVRNVAWGCFTGVDGNDAAVANSGDPAASRVPDGVAVPVVAVD
jgi:hypothetical protein